MALPEIYHTYAILVLTFLIVLLLARIFPTLFHLSYDYYVTRMYIGRIPIPPPYVLDKLDVFRKTAISPVQFEHLPMPTESVLIVMANEYAKRERIRWLQKKLQTTESDVETLKKMNLSRHRLQDEYLRHSMKIKRAQEAATIVARKATHKQYVEDYIVGVADKRYRTGLVRGKGRMAGGDRNELKPLDVYYSLSFPKDLLAKEMDHLDEEKDRNCHDLEE